MHTTTKFALATLLLFSVTLQAKTYAVVDGSKITDDDINIIMLQMNAKPGTTYKTLPKEDKKIVLDQAISRQLLIQYAKKTGTAKTKEYKKMLENLKDDLALELWQREQFKKVKVSNDEAKKIYDENKKKFVDKKTKKQLSFDKVKTTIIQQVRLAKYQQLIQAEIVKLKQTSKIEFK
jgi:hypothetical protein